MTPSAQISAGGPTVSPARNRSGARKSSVPTMDWPVSDASPAIRAIPKSTRKIESSSATRMLVGLTSRCTTLARCTATRPRRTCSPILAIDRSSSVCCLMMSCSDRPLMYSITIHGSSSMKNTSWIGTIA